MIEDIQAAIPLGFFLSFMIGPVFFVLLETSATKGFRAALIFDLGVILADIIFITAAYFSSFQLLENLSNQPGLYVFGGVILLVYGIITFKTKQVKLRNEDVKVTSGDYLSLFVKGFLLNFINIGVLVFWLGIIIIVGPSLDNNSDRILVFFGSMIGAYFVTDLFKMLLAKQLRKKLTPKRIFLVKKLLGIILIICGLVLITKGFLPKDKLNFQEGIELIREAEQK
ncbi:MULTISPECIES: LysE family translocator [Cellulophaga]|jgi:threonine/homoserine/homoserine lactone efflux protein|uniref:Threonine/homoserine/homoserine lactone efflux protein n=2 Tax=Cellulophaga baltica TaxID=76594 RepID=A0A1G7FJW3_9FLAO|nr:MULTISPECIES: LysE family transporter [Cellulophaga]AIY12632.1 lysine transporter LysE [Cellulophaga baltica NN016038]AIZ40986.1 lysine transporter LysE [Cellulophaga baltica 18]KGK30503.1 lysine transporter LysE [Cellulophaga sp. E6(2014)]MBA6313849.1 LysE family translocator [Cellulophaga baltica]MCR1023172.1 LysE family transporter [Cellulophaga baltica]